MPEKKKKKFNELQEEIGDWKMNNSGSERKRFEELENIQEYWKEVDSGLAESLIFLCRELISLRRTVNQHDRDIDSLYGIEH
jgi:hypothetical protein